MAKKLKEKKQSEELNEEKGKAGEKTKKSEEAKIESTEVEAEKTTLVPLEEYIKSSIHLGTKVITSHMRPYVYKRRADGLAIINTNIIDKKLKAAASFLSQFEPEDIVVTCKREAGWLALKSMNKYTGIRVFTKKYPAGIITNPSLPDFFEPKAMMIIDPWLDKNPLLDAMQINIPIIALCDTNNMISYIDLVIACNNKSNKSIGLIFWILAREYCKAKGMQFKAELTEFTGVQD